MRPDQRQQIIDDFQKASLKVSADTFKKARSAYTEVHTPCSSNAVDEEMQHYSISIQEPMANDIATFCTDLNISAEDSGISTISLVTLNAIWAKAIELLSTSNAITSAPVSQRKACMVILTSCSSLDTSKIRWTVFM